jgi:hypothetical protein
MLNKKVRKTKQLQSTSQSSELDQTRKKETREWMKLHNNKHSCKKEIEQHQKHLNEEIAGVNQMLKDGAISKDIYERYLKILEIGYAEKIQETRDKFGF